MKASFLPHAGLSLGFWSRAAQVPGKQQICPWLFSFCRAENPAAGAILKCEGSGLLLSPSAAFNAGWGVGGGRWPKLCRTQASHQVRAAMDAPASGQARAALAPIGNDSSAASPRALVRLVVSSCGVLPRNRLLTAARPCAGAPQWQGPARKHGAAGGQRRRHADDAFEGAHTAPATQ